MSKLDEFQPEGESIHPFDLYELINNSSVHWCDIQHVKYSPIPVNVADYERNRSKVGAVISIGGKLYFETTSIPPKTKATI